MNKQKERRLRGSLLFLLFVLLTNCGAAPFSFVSLPRDLQFPILRNMGPDSVSNLLLSCKACQAPVLEYIKSNLMDPGIWNAWIETSAVKGYTLLFQLLIRANKTVQDPQKIYKPLCRSGNTLMLVYFLNRTVSLDPQEYSAMIGDCLVEATIRKNFKLFKQLVAYEVPSNPDKLFRKAAAHGNRAVLDQLIEMYSGTMEYSEYFSLAFYEAACHGKVRVLRRLIESDTVSRDEFNSRMFQDGAVDEYGEDFICAVQSKSIQSVQYLLSLKELGYNIDVSSNGNLAFVHACLNGMLEIVNALIQLPESDNVNPASLDNEAFIGAVANNHLAVVQYLANLPEEYGIDPAARNNQAFIIACQNGHFRLVKYLASLPSVDPSAQENQALILASENGHFAVVQFLLALDESRGVRVDAQGYRALYVSLRKRHYEISKLLLSFNYIK